MWGIKSAFKVQGLPNGRMSFSLMATGKLGRHDMGKVRNGVFVCYRSETSRSDITWQLDL